MTDDIERLAREAVEQAGRATPAPWVHPGHGNGILHSSTWVVSNAPYEQHGRIMRDDDGEWISSARTREPLLAAEVLRLRAWLRSFKRDIKRVEDEHAPFIVPGMAISLYDIEGALEGNPAPSEEPKA